MLARPRAVLFACVGACAVALPGVLFAPDAHACGGCFIPPGTPTVVSGHRMVMSVSQSQTVLWDQIQYSGEPEEFAWVLPVKPGARVEAATAAFFEVLEGQTQTLIVPAPVNCGGGSSGVGCGSAALSFDDEAGDGGEDPSANGGQTVEVVHQGTVGPYETVTLSTETPGALNQWLEDHGYNVDDTSQPIIDQYVEEGFDFIALRLQPGKGVQQMTPVRVVMEGGAFTLPLRMVGIGTGALTPIVLYVVGEGRYMTSTFSPVSINTALLAWDYETSESNYTALRETALARNDGKSAMTTFANQGVITNSFIFDPTTGGSISFTQLYANQALSNGEISTACQIADLSFVDGRVRNPCPPGEPWNSAACGVVDSTEIDARTLGCVGAEDIAVAVEGMNLLDVWITRLEMNLPRTALETDLVLQADTNQDSVFNSQQAQIALHPEQACGGGSIPRSADTPTPKDRFAALVGLAMSAVGLGLLGRRLRRSSAKA